MIVTWELAGIVTGIVTAIVAVSTTYLRLSIGNAVKDSEKQILAHVDTKYVSRELQKSEIDDLERRIDIIEKVRHPRVR